MRDNPNKLKNALIWGLSPSRWVKDNFDIEPDPWQRDLLDGNYPRVLLNCCRQSGKSTTCSLIATHTGIFKPKSLTIIVSPSQRQSAELFKKCTDFLSQLDEKPAISEETKTQLQLENKSRIVSVPGSEATIRGYSAPDLILIDESARVPDEIYESVRPMLAASQGGRLMALSTPFGRRGWWWRAYMDGGPGWHRIEINADMCPRISRDFLEQERATLPEATYAQEYGCSFEDSAGRLFSSVFIDQMFRQDAEIIDIPDYGTGFGLS